MTCELAPDCVRARAVLAAPLRVGREYDSALPPPLEGHAFTHAIFNAVAGLLEERRLLLRSGTIVDATIIAAPSSTKNASAARDPGMKQTPPTVATDTSR